MTAETKLPQSDSSAPSGRLHPLVGPFERSLTSQWRQRDATLEALENIKYLADELHLLLNWRERESETIDDDLKKAGQRIADLYDEFLVLWPNGPDQATRRGARR